MPETTILIDDDLSAQRLEVRQNGRDWVFDFEQGSIGWYRRYIAWSTKEREIIEKDGLDANLQQLYDLAEEVLCPANGDRARLDRIGPRGVAAALGFFAASWYSGNPQAFALALMQQRPAEMAAAPAAATVPETAAAAPASQPAGRKRRAA